MSSIITAILGAAVGLFCDKARDSAANKLKDGDLADEKLREIIVKDLTDIKSKLDCLSLQYVGASCSFLKQGVIFLNLALDKSNKDQKASEGSADEATRVMNDTASGILDAALSLPQAIQKSEKISSDKRFISAQYWFKKSHEAATYPFNNKSLSIKDRIMACMLRVAATILELGLEDPKAATTACRQSLEELHDLPTIRKMFAVFLKGGLKSKFSKAKRLENIKSVLFINHALYVSSKYSSESPYLFTWPAIESKDRTFHPILHAHEILTKTSTGEEFVQQLNRVVVDSRIRSAEFVVNSRGEIILLTDHEITVIYSTGESKDVVFPDPTETNVVDAWGRSIAVDSDDNVFAITRLKTRDENGSVKQDFVLYIYDENYNIKHVSVLDFLEEAGKYPYVNIAVDKNQNLIMLTSWNNQVYVCDNLGNFKFQFDRDGIWLRRLSISKNNDIMIGSRDHRAVLTYSTEGNLKPTIKLPEGHEVEQVAFHHGICKIIVLTYVEKEDSFFLLGYSETGELGYSVFFCKRDTLKYWWDIDMNSHPSGPIAVKFLNSLTFI